MLGALAREQAEADTARAFLPIAAAFGYAARLKSDPRDAWDGVRELAADDRAPVRIGLTDALHAFSARAAGNVDLLVAHAAEWLELDDRDHVYAAQAIALDVVAASREAFPRSASASAARTSSLFSASLPSFVTAGA